MANKETTNLKLALTTDETTSFKDWHRLINGEGPIVNDAGETIAEKSNMEILDDAFNNIKTIENVDELPVEFSSEKFYRLSANNKIYYHTLVTETSTGEWKELSGGLKTIPVNELPNTNIDTDALYLLRNSFSYNYNRDDLTTKTFDTKFQGLSGDIEPGVYLDSYTTLTYNSSKVYTVKKPSCIVISGNRGHTTGPNLTVTQKDSNGTLIKSETITTTASSTLTFYLLPDDVLIFEPSYSSRYGVYYTLKSSSKTASISQFIENEQYDAYCYLKNSWKQLNRASLELAGNNHVITYADLIAENAFADIGGPYYELKYNIDTIFNTATKLKIESCFMTSSNGSYITNDGAKFLSTLNINGSKLYAAYGDNYATALIDVEGLLFDIRIYRDYMLLVSLVGTSRSIAIEDYCDFSIASSTQIDKNTTILQVGAQDSSIFIKYLAKTIQDSTYDIVSRFSIFSKQNTKLSFNNIILNYLISNIGDSVEYSIANYKIIAKLMELNYNCGPMSTQSYVEARIELTTNSYADTTADAFVSPTSTNPVQNQAITNYVDTKLDLQKEALENEISEIQTTDDILDVRALPLTAEPGNKVRVNHDPDSCEFVEPTILKYNNLSKLTNVSYAFHRRRLDSALLALEPVLDSFDDMCVSFDCFCVNGPSVSGVHTINITLQRNYINLYIDEGEDVDIEYYTALDNIVNIDIDNTYTWLDYVTTSKSEYHNIPVVILFTEDDDYTLEKIADRLVNTYEFFDTQEEALTFIGMFFDIYTNDNIRHNSWDIIYSDRSELLTDKIANEAARAIVKETILEDSVEQLDTKITNLVKPNEEGKEAQKTLSTVTINNEVFGIDAISKEDVDEAVAEYMSTHQSNYIIANPENEAATANLNTVKIYGTVYQLVTKAEFDELKSWVKLLKEAHSMLDIDSNTTTRTGDNLTIEVVDQELEAIEVYAEEI